MRLMAVCFSFVVCIFWIVGKNPKIKNVKFLTNGASTCRDITQIRNISFYHLLDLKSMQNPYVFVAFSGRVGDIADLGDVSAR